MTTFKNTFISFFFSSRRRHTRCLSDWSSDVCSADLSEPRRSRTPEDERAVGAAETEGVGERDADRHPPGLVRHVVEVARRIGRAQIDGRRRNLLAECERAEYRFDGARGAEQVAGH